MPPEPPRLVPFDVSREAAFVAAWNSTFRDRRNFWPLTPEVFRDRIAGVETAIECFEPADLILALRGDEVVGFCHVGVHSEGFCEACFAGWAGGTLGYVAAFGVVPSARGQGVGGTLWNEAMVRLQAARVARIAVDGQCLNPFYGNSAGPRTPFFGTPEGIGIGWGDAGTRRFLANRGHEPRFKGVSLELPLAGREFGDVEAVQRGLHDRGLELRAVPNAFPDPGTLLIEARTFDAPFDFEAVSCTRAGLVQGYLVHYPMTEVSAKRRGIFELQVLDTARGQGIGSAILGTSLSRMQADRFEVCEVFTIPELSPGALDLYLKTGFNVVTEWAVY